MIVKLIVCCLTSLIDVATFVVFKGATTLILGVLKLLSNSGNAAGGVIEVLRGIFGTIGEYVFSLLWEIITSVISGFFEFVGSTINGFVELMLEAFLELMKLSKEGFEELLGLMQEVFGGLAEIVGKLIVSVLDNFQEALGFIFQKITESES